jgi:tRNA 2-selenouridine synthase
VWIEAESKKIGNVQLPDALFEAMHQASPIRIEAPMQERVRLWREDYAHLAADPVAMVEQLEPLKPLIGGKELAKWRELAVEGNVDALFERVMVHHYDPCYARSTKRSYRSGEVETIALPSLGHDQLLEAARDLAARYGSL